MNQPSLRPALEAIVGADQVRDRPVDRVAFSADASVYRLIPRAVVFPDDLEEIRGLFRFSHASGTPLTFRGAGTSLSGQAISDGVLVEVQRHWRRVEVLDGGARVRVQPGIIGGQVNAILRPNRAKIGPDPASINACTMGGILANNSSGMCCGVAQNAYHTLDSLTFVLPSGTTIDTAQPDAEARFLEQEPALAQGLLALKAGNRGRPGPGRAHPLQVPDQEHHRLFAERLPGLRDAAGDLPQPPGGLGGHAGLHRRSGAAHRA